MLSIALEKVINNSYIILNESSEDAHFSCCLSLDLYLMVIFKMMQCTKFPQYKLGILQNTLKLVVSFAKRDHAHKKESFLPLPYYRLLVSAFLEVTTNCKQLGIRSDQMVPFVDAFCSSLSHLTPSEMPLFFHAYFKFLAHPHFIKNCLDLNKPKLWKNYYLLLRSLIFSITPFVVHLQTNPLCITSQVARVNKVCFLAIF